MQLDLTTPTLNVWPYGDGTYRCSTPSLVIARRINDITRDYKSLDMQIGDEPLFRLKRDQVALVLKAAFGDKSAKALLVGKEL